MPHGKHTRVLQCRTAEEGNQMPTAVPPAKHPLPDAQTEGVGPEPDPVEELCRIGDAYKQATGLTADEAIARILSKVRSK